MIGLIAAAAVIAASAAIVEAMLAPAVTITPAGPGTHAQEYPVEEKSRPIKARRSASIGWIFVIAEFANWRNTHFDVHLCFRRRHQD
jgi:hypothetical protein